ncbi:MAG: hypothetical protein AB7U46_10540, partial [Paenirhodobacter sp.]|uniref:hypothetical protein n=1 Tax=Paenirhodobacter sp. TaxID=1965326 RepID=UPI003D09948E
MIALRVGRLLNLRRSAQTPTGLKSQLDESSVAGLGSQQGKCISSIGFLFPSLVFALPGLRQPAHMPSREWHEDIKDQPKRRGDQAVCRKKGLNYQSNQSNCACQYTYL